jgi:hypothetical protein
MIAQPAHSPPTEQARPATPAVLGETLRARTGWCCAALGFLCFMPYPALPVGSYSAVQAGNALALVVSVPVLLVSWKRRPFWVFPLLMAPLCVSALKAGLAQESGLDLCLKALVVWGVSMVTVLATQALAPRHALHLLAGVAAAVLVHAAVGLWQLYSFSNGEFPLAGIYVNPSFLSVQNDATIIARYVRRPFGLFPEPSAMSASLAPWVVFLFALGTGAVRLWDQPTRRQRTLFSAAALAGLGLIIVSRSGHAAVTSLAVVAFVAAWFARARATGRTYAAVVTVFGVFLPAVIYLAAVSLADRLGGKSELGNSSWGERADSLRLGFALFADSDAASKLFGLGAGMMSPALQSTAGLDAVYSVLLTYVYETGVVGAAAVVWVGHYLLRVWAASRYDMTFAAVFLVWLVGVTVITSYEQLLPLWMTLGWLTVWPAVCRPAEVPFYARVSRPAAPAAARFAAVPAQQGGVA